MSYLLASIVYALTARLPWDVRRYFIVQFFATISIQVAVQFLGTRSPYYAAIYSAFTILIIFTMFGIVADKMKRWILAWMAGVLVSWICFVALPKPLHYYNWISLAEGMTLATCGSLLIYNARKGLHLALAVLWLTLSAWRLCYCLEMTEASWRAMNLWFPAFACICCFTGIGYRCRMRE